ncbi:MAG: hypothetical protein FJ125_09725 [Deltaproteobacteria bacterium]|nr:hypothetical protein [Deltaproteobacteria bacterium]
MTNYALYKAMHSSANERNAFELVHTLERQWGAQGLYRGLPLLNFLDNHDVARLASILTEPVLQFPLDCLMFTVPGVPSVYYGFHLRSSTDLLSFSHELRLPGRTRRRDELLRPGAADPGLRRAAGKPTRAAVALDEAGQGHRAAAQRVHPRRSLPPCPAVRSPAGQRAVPALLPERPVGLGPSRPDPRGGGLADQRHHAAAEPL